MSITEFQRYPLTFGPSPVHPLERLTEHLGGEDSTVLYAHLGGQPALNAYSGIFDS